MVLAGRARSESIPRMCLGLGRLYLAIELSHSAGALPGTIQLGSRAWPGDETHALGYCAWTSEISAAQRGCPY